MDHHEWSFKSRILSGGECAGVQCDQHHTQTPLEYKKKAHTDNWFGVQNFAVTPGRNRAQNSDKMLCSTRSTYWQKFKSLTICVSRMLKLILTRLHWQSGCMVRILRAAGDNDDAGDGKCDSRSTRTVNSICIRSANEIIISSSSGSGSGW